MTFSETLVALRKREGLSQERLAEKLGVSRQAVTKWETGGGEPTLENLRAIATLFHVSFDELLGGELSAASRQEASAESVTDYDIDAPKRFDIHLGGVRTARVSADGGEKLRIRLFSDSIGTLQSDCKVKLDDIKNRIDVSLVRRNRMTRATAQSALHVEIVLPQAYLSALELFAHAAELSLSSLACPSVELDGRIAALSLCGVQGRVQVQSNLDMGIALKDFSGSLDLNQLFATSRLSVPPDFLFRMRTRGIMNGTHYTENGVPCGPFSDEEAQNRIELNGMKSELLIAR